MADNAIDLIVAKEAYAQLDKLITGLNEVDAKVADTVAKANAQFKNMGSITTPSMSGDNSAQMAELNRQIKELSDTTKKYETQIKALSEAKKNYNRTVSQESVDTTIANRNAREAFQATSKLISEYDKLDLAHKKAMKSAQAIGAQYGSTSKEFLQASVNFKKLDDEIKAIDATLGKNNRNVGNYKSGFNGLSNSINQLTREAPAFANSIGTGFMALSNNIPILADEIANLRQKNLDLAKSGQPTQSMFKTLTSAIFSWQTALSVGVTLLTIYGKDLVELAFGLSASEKAQKQLKDGMDELNNSTSTQVVTLKTLSDIVLDTSNSEKDRKTALTALKELVPELNKADVNHAESLKDVTYWTNKYVEASINRAKADGLIKMISEEQTKLDTLKGQSTKDRIKWYQQIFIGLSSMVGNKKNAVKIVANSFKEEELALSDNITDMSKMLEQYILKAEESEQNLKGLANNKKGDKSAQKAEEDRLKAIYEANKSAIEKDIQLNSEKLNNEELFIIERLALLDKDKELRNALAEVDYKEQIRLAKGNHDKQITAENNFVSNKSKINEDYNKKQTDLIKKQLTSVEKLAKSISELDPVKELGKSANATEKELYKMGKQLDANVKSVEDLQKATQEYAKSFLDEFASKSGLTETFKMFGDNGLFTRMSEGMAFTKDSWKTDTIEMMEGVQEMYNFISNASQQNFEAEYARLESQKEIALGFAGDSAVAKDKIEKDAEKKKKEIANRENKAKQKQAIFNIAIDTAQAIIATLAKTPPPAGIPMALFVGALGAVQIGMVASQKIPQYFDGTDNHTGGLMLVNDGKGANYKEKVVLPNGQVILPQDRNVLMEAPKGTKVLNHEQQLFEMLQGKGVSMSVAQSQGMTADEMDMILAKHFSGIKTHNTTIDKNGFNSYIRNGNSITRMNSNRSQGIGLSV